MIILNFGLEFRLLDRNRLLFLQCTYQMSEEISYFKFKFLKLHIDNSKFFHIRLLTPFGYLVACKRYLQFLLDGSTRRPIKVYLAPTIPSAIKWKPSKCFDRYEHFGPNLASLLMENDWNEWFLQQNGAASCTFTGPHPKYTMGKGNHIYAYMFPGYVT